MNKLAKTGRRRRKLRSIVRMSIATLLLTAVFYGVAIGRLRSLIQSHSEEVFVADRLRAADALLAVDVLMVFYAEMVIARDRQSDQSVRTLRAQRDAIRGVASMVAPRTAISGGQASVGTADTWNGTSPHVTSLTRRLGMQKPSGSVNPRMTMRDIGWLHRLHHEVARTLYESIRGNLDKSWHERGQLGTEFTSAWFLILVSTVACAMFLAALMASATGTGIGLAIVKTRSAAQRGTGRHRAARSISKASGERVRKWCWRCLSGRQPNWRLTNESVIGRRRSPSCAICFARLE